MASRPTKWDDLRIFLAVARSGSLAAAARSLGVDEATVSRRVAALEKSLGVRLFARLARGHRLTQAGTQLVPSLEAMDEAATGIERRLSGTDARLEGTVRVTTTEPFASNILMAHLPAFREQYPGIELELVLGYESLNLSRRDADVAVRLTAPTQAALLTRKVGRAGVGLYASTRYLDRSPPLNAADRYAGHLFVGPGAQQSGWSLAEAEWIAAHASQARMPLKTSSMFTALAAVRAGLGLGLLPCSMGDDLPGLQRVAGPLFYRDIHLVFHRDLQRNGRVRAVLDFLAQVVEAEKARLRGEEPRARSSPVH